MKKEDLLACYRVIEVLEKENSTKGISNSIVIIKNLIANKIVQLDIQESRKSDFNFLAK